MRENIGLYRGKRIDNDEWAIGNLLVFPDLTSYICCPDADNGEILVKYSVDPETVGECSGVTDKNGKKIFEGDIVEHHVQADIIVNRGVVNWDAKNARWAHQLNTMNPCFTFFKADAFEVIGNIHDNPELLEAADG